MVTKAMTTALVNRERAYGAVIADVGWVGERCRAGMVGLLLLASIAGGSGCHSSRLFASQTPSLDDAQFMAAWKTYLHCRSSVVLEEIKADLHQLNHVAQVVSKSGHASTLFLPDTVRMQIAASPSRLAVDPHAMSAACALHGGSVAQAAGRSGLSVVLLTAVAAAQQKTPEAYYAAEARHRLEKMDEEMALGEQVAELVDGIIMK